MRHLLAVLIVFGLTCGCAYGTVPSDTSRVSSLYACDGSDTTFTFTFGLTDDDDLEVILVTDSTGAETPLTKNTHYTVASANANDPQSWDQGGTVTTVATYSSSYSIWLRSDVARTQATNIDDEDVEAALDKLTYIAADIYEVLSRCLKVQPTESGDTVQFSYDGTAGYVYRSAAGDFSTVASVDAGSLTVGSFWEDTLTGSTLATAQSDLMIPQGLYVVTAHPYHATGDGSTNDANAIQTAIDAAEAAAKAGGAVQIPPGTYHLDDSLVWNATYAYGGATNAKVLVRGASQYGSIVTRDSADANGFAVEVTGDTGWEQGFWGFQDVMFDGGSGRDTSGISVNVAGRSGMALENCAFWRTDIGYKNVGAIDWTIRDCSFNRGNVGIWLEALSTMHGGCGRVDKFNASYNAQAGIYIQGKASSAYMEQLTFAHGVLEGNTGFGIYVDHWNDDWPLVFEDIYFETNGTADSTTLDGTTYHDPQLLYLHDANNVRFIDCKLTNGTEDEAGGDIIDSIVYTYNCYLLPAYGDFNLVGNSRMYHSHPRVAGNYVFDGNEICVDAMLPYREFAEGTSYRTMMRHQLKPWNYDSVATNLLATGSCAMPFTPADANGQTYSFVIYGDAPGFGTYLSVRLPVATSYDDGVQLWANFTRDANAIYVFSLDVKTDTNDAELSVASIGGDGNLLLYQATSEGTGCHAIMAVAREWRRFYGYATDIYDTDVQDVYVYNKGATAETFCIANVQLLKFSRYSDVIEWVEQGKYPWPTNVPRVVHGVYNLTGNLAFSYGTDNGMRFDNDGAVDGDSDPNTVTVTLPATTIGQRYFFRVTDANDIIIDPAGSDLFIGHSGGKYLRLDDQGCTVEIESVTEGVWELNSGVDPNTTDHAMFKWQS